jgi:ribosome-binding factor A
MRNIQQINETLKKELAMAVEELVEFPDGIITVSWVECDPNFSSARIGISVLPDFLAGTALEKLRKASGEVAHHLRSRLRFRHMPKFFWVFDSTEKKADSIERIFDKIEKGEEDEEEIKYE